MAALLKDFAFALRALRRAPLLFTTAVLTLAVGIGLSTGVFAVAYGVLLRPRPFPEPGRLVVINIGRALGPRGSNIPLAEFPEWQHRTRAFERIAAYSSSEFTLRGAGEPRSVRATLVTDGFFETLGVEASEGSTRRMASGSSAVAFSRRLAEKLAGASGWREQGVTVGAGSFAVAAVMPATFTFPAETTDLWLRAERVPRVSVFSRDDQRRYQLIGRLAPGVTIQQAEDDVKRVLRELAAASPKPVVANASVRPLQERDRTEARATVIPFTAGAVLVLVIACANVSGLLLGRAVARQREFAVRRALGGEWRHVLRASLAESLTIAFVGWAAGLWVAYLVVRGFEALAGSTIHNMQAVRIDVTVMIASLLLAVLVALVTGAAPAFRATRMEAGAALKHTSERIGRAGSKVRGLLVVGQIAMTVVLLVSAGLLTRTVLGITFADRSFDTAHALALRLMLAEATQFNAIDRAPRLNSMLDEVRRLPGVVAAGVGSDLPPNGGQLTVTVRLVSDTEDVVQALTYGAVTPGYLEALGIKPLAGRLFEAQDRTREDPVAIITRTAGATLFSGRDPVGRDFPASMPRADGTRKKLKIVGVVPDIEYGGLDHEAGPSIFTVWETLAPANAHLVVRTTGDPLELGPAVRGAVQAFDPTLPVFTPQPLEDVVSGSIADRWLRLQLAAAFAALALALATIALSGTVAQSVLDRRHELAVRLAIGATQEEAVRLLLRGGLVLTLLGVTLGAGGGLATARALRHLLYGVAPWDPLTYASGIVIAILVAAAACYVPARRAASINPAILLRES